MDQPDLDQGNTARVVQAVLRVQMAEGLDDVADALLGGATELIECEHAIWGELDLLFGRPVTLIRDAELAELVDRQGETWPQPLPTHPLILRSHRDPDGRVLRLSDLADVRRFWETPLYREIHRLLDSDNRIVLSLGPPRETLALPVRVPPTVGIGLVRWRPAFSDRERAVSALYQTLVGPLWWQRRAKHYASLLRSGQLTPELLSSLMGFGLSQRQAEVCFWILQGKSNAEIGEILGIGTQTVRHHSIQVFSRLRLPGRFALQHAVVMALLGIGSI